MFTDHSKDRLNQRYGPFDEIQLDKLMSNLANKIRDKSYVVCRVEPPNILEITISLDKEYRLLFNTRRRTVITALTNGYINIYTNIKPSTNKYQVIKL